MKEIEQSITGDNNVQVGVNNGQIINTKKVNLKKEVLHTPGLHITDAQALHIREKIIAIAEMVATNGGNKASLIKKEYNTFYKQFGCTSYKTLQIEMFDNAVLWLKKRTEYLGKKNLRHGDNDEWRKSKYTAINSRARQLGMDKDKMLMFAQDKLELKEPLKSIKDLSSTRLEKLYKFIFAIRVK